MKEAHLIVNLSPSWGLGMNVFCEVKLNGEIKRTSTSKGKQPKWTESFKFKIEDDNEGFQVEITLFHKPFFPFQADEKIGSTFFVASTKNEVSNSDWRILSDDNDN